MNLEFRSWDGKKFSFSSDYHGEGIPAWALSEFFEWATHDIIQQWTGLTDSTGRKIFEGDIVQEIIDDKPAYFGQIVFNAGTFFISGDGPMFNYWDVESAVPNSYKNHRIIGNTFETPELLK